MVRELNPGDPGYSASFLGNYLDQFEREFDRIQSRFSSIYKPYLSVLKEENRCRENYKVFHPEYLARLRRERFEESQIMCKSQFLELFTAFEQTFFLMCSNFARYGGIPHIERELMPEDPFSETNQQYLPASRRELPNNLKCFKDLRNLYAHQGSGGSYWFKRSQISLEQFLYNIEGVELLRSDRSVHLALPKEGGYRLAFLTSFYISDLETFLNRFHSEVLSYYRDVLNSVSEIDMRVKQ